MLRTVLLSALLLPTIACDKPEAKDKTTILFDLIEGDGGSAGGVAFHASAGPQVREMDTYLDITFSGLFAEGSVPRVDATALEGLESVGSGSMADGQTKIELTPDIRKCDGAAYQEREDGGCEYALVVLIAADQPYSLFGTFSMTAQADEDWTGDPETVELTVEAEAAQEE